MLNTYIFDFNGTMIFDSAIQHDSWAKTLKELFDHQMSEADFQNHIAGRNNAYTFNYFAGHPLSPAKIDELSMIKEQEYRQMCLARPAEFRLVTGLPALLDDCLAKHFKLNIATASEQANVDFFFDHLNLDRWFSPDNVILNNGQLPGKPAPDMFLAAIKQVGSLPANSAIFEDSPSGIQAANRAQVQATILVVDPTMPAPKLVNNLMVSRQISDFNELLV